MYVGTVALAFAVLFVAASFGLGTESGPASIASFLLFYGLAPGAGHPYLAVRGDGVTDPVEARRRYLAALAVLLVAGAAIFHAGSTPVATVELGTIGLLVVAVPVAAYLVTESIAGYRALGAE